MTQKVVVTGAAGYVGRHVVHALLEQGAEVVAIVRKRRAYRVDERATVVEMDLFDPDVSLIDVFDGADALVHLAWEAGFAHNDPTHMLRVSDHYRVLAEAADLGVRICALGTVHEVGYHNGMVTAETPTEPTTLYGIAKDALRRAAFASLAAKVPVQWLRAYYIVGDDRNNQSVFTKLLAAAEAGQRTFPFTTGRNEYDFIQVDDLGRQIAAVACRSDISGTINVASGKPVSLRAQVEDFIATHALNIELEIGAFPDRPYDSPRIFADVSTIQAIMGEAASGTPSQSLPRSPAR